MASLPDIEYEYHAAGVRYTSLNLVPENTSYTPSTMVERYIAGKPVTVYYNPDNPKQTLLCLTERRFQRRLPLPIACNTASR